jgi:trehalose 6-phosphate synthase
MPFPADDPCFTLRCLSLSERDINEYYYGFSDRGLWPLGHYFVGRCQFRGDQWQGYRRANGVFAAAILDELRTGDTVWVQDFHLTLVPALVRAANSRVRLGFFWHIPFPEPSVFGILPWRGPVLEGMLGSDVIGFHLESYDRHFLACVQQFLGLKVDRERGVVYVGGREVRVVAHAIGVDADAFERTASKPEVVQRTARIRRQLGSERIVLGVDRLDYTKGILERLAGFERFLAESPEFRRKITLVQIAVPSRERVQEYRRMKKEIDEAVGRISGRFTAEGWVPICYIYRGLTTTELTAYYAAADLALVTPLRDGMNLVAKEYVATRVNDDGVLILSEFAGAAEDMPEAVRVNPYSIDDLAAQLRSALAMPPHEARSRMTRLRKRVRERDIRWWLTTLLAELGPVPSLPIGATAGK